MPFLSGLLLGLWIAGLCAVLLWWRAIGQLDERIALAGVAVLVAGLGAWSSWSRLPTGNLAWDGEVWRWESPSFQTGAAEHELAVIADFQHQLLLRIENQAGASLWLWLEKKAMPERWMDLRRAVFSPHKPSVALPRHDFLSEPPSGPPSGSASIPGARQDQQISLEKA